MDDKMKQDMMVLFNQGFEEVVLPQIEEIRDDLNGVKEGLIGVKKELKDVKNELKKQGERLDRVEIKLDKVIEKQDDHETRIQKLEQKNIRLA